MKFKFNPFDGLSQEWNHRVKLRLGWFVLLLIGIIALGFYIGKRFYIDRNLTPTQKYVASVVDEFNVRRHFDGRTYGTFWDYCGVTLTADHVPASMADDGIGFVKRPVHRSNGVIDGAHYGDWTCATPKYIAEGDKVSLIGYPGGSEYPSIRKGEVYLRRSVSGSAGYEVPTWIVVFETQEPVVGGMSGGIVVNSSDVPVGIVVVQNSPADLNGDGEEQHSADIVSLRDYWLHRISL